MPNSDVHACAGSPKSTQQGSPPSSPPMRDGAGHLLSLRSAKFPSLLPRPEGSHSPRVSLPRAMPVLRSQEPGHGATWRSQRPERAAPALSAQTPLHTGPDAEMRVQNGGLSAPSLDQSISMRKQLRPHFPQNTGPHSEAVVSESLEGVQKSASLHAPWGGLQPR